MTREVGSAPKVTLSGEEQAKLDGILAKLSPHIIETGVKGVSGYMPEKVYDRPVREILTGQELQDFARLQTKKVFGADIDCL